MNVMDRSLSSAADHVPATVKLAATRKRRRKIALGVVVALVVVVALYLVWAMTLCGDCGGAPVPLPPPPA